MKDKEWDELLYTMQENASDKYCKTEEYEHQKQRYEQINEYLSTNLTLDQKTMVDEVLNEFAVAEGRRMEIAYRQGIKDCVWLLKNLGVLA